MKRNRVELRDRTRKLIIGFIFILVISAAQEINGQDVGDAAPGFTVDLVDGGTFTLADQAGKVVMIFFFGNGCPYCVTSGPLVQDLYETYRNDPDFVAIGLDTWDNTSDLESVSNFATSTGITFPLALKANSVKLDYGWNYDRIVVVDKEGIIRRKSNTAASNDIFGSDEAIQASLAGTVAVEGLSAFSGFKVYPNPVSDILYIDVTPDQASVVQLVISDITGRERKNVSYPLEAGQKKMSVNTRDLAGGLYFYTLRLNDKTEAGKFLIQ